MNNVAGHLTVLSFILSIQSRFSASLAALIGPVLKIVLNPVDLYIKKDITSASSSFPLLDANTKQLRGVVSFNANGRLAQNRAVVFNKIFIGYQTDAAAGKEGELVYNKAAIGALYNADLIISQDGREVLRQNISSLMNLGTPQAIDDNYATLENLRYLVDDQDVEIDLEFANGVSMPASGVAYQYLFVKIKGYETQRKSLK